MKKIKLVRKALKVIYQNIYDVLINNDKEWGKGQLRSLNDSMGRLFSVEKELKEIEDHLNDIINVLNNNPDKSISVLGVELESIKHRLFDE